MRLLMHHRTVQLCGCMYVVRVNVLTGFLLLSCTSSILLFIYLATDSNLPLWLFITSTVVAERIRVER